VLDETLDSLYEEGNPLFLRCADTYGDERGDSLLGELILQIWQKTRCHPDPMGWLKGMAENFPGSGWKSILLSQALCIAETFRRDYIQVQDSPYEENWRQDLNDMDVLISRLDDWNQASEYLEKYNFLRLKSLPKGIVDEGFKDLRERWKKALSGKIKDIINGTADSHIERAEDIRPLLAGLTDAVCAFDRAVTEEKTRLAVLEFTDVQRIALRLLEGKPPARFVEILVDEMQDINPLQDMIITALSRDGENIFYVGDTRQSIYRFQMAEPEIFQKKLDTAPNKVPLTKNFRSHKPILDAVNHVFSRVDCPEMGRMKEDGFLISGETGDDMPGAPVELLVSGNDEMTEAERVAKRLRRLIDAKEAKPGDCVILLRSPKSRVAEYTAALKREGLDCAEPPGEGYFNRPEIITLMSVLEAIDNARMDIPLICALRSPIAGCTPDELAELRTLSRGALYECLPLSDNQKIKEFIKLFQAWRDIAADLPPYLLAARIMSDTSLPQKMDGDACENLLLLPEVLREYHGGLRGLGDWLRKQESAVPPGGCGAARQPRLEQGICQGEQSTPVRIISIHSSKGLEFPVVVVAGLDKKINLQDKNKRLLAHSRLGIGIKLREGLTETPTPHYRAVQAVMDGETRAEELRLLYVAMTRAEKRLILSVGAMPEGRVNQTVTKGDIILRSNVADWLLMARSPDWKVVEEGIGAAAGGVADGVPRAGEKAERHVMPDWSYPYAEAVDAPSKMTATGLKGRNPDEQTHEGAEVWRAASALPPAEKGVATHLFLQFAEFDKCLDTGGVAREIKRLAARELLTAGQADAIDIEKMENFFKTARAITLSSAKGLRRELKFSILVQNGEIPGLAIPEGEKVLLQGVIDCCYETEGGLALLDFKTDRVKPGGEKSRAEHYRPQMQAYAAALGAITGKPVTERVLVFLSTGREIILFSHLN
jgi:ATP-dependent helicase/nuclease subunit A